MAVRMRLTRVGSKKNPIYRVVVADSRSPRDGKFIDIVGRYNPQHEPSTDRIRRGQGQGLALEGRSALAARRAPAQSQEHRVVSTVSAPADLVLFLATKIVEDPEAVRVEEIESDGDLLLRLHVAEGDRGGR